MDLWRIVLVGFVALGLVLFFFSGPEEIPGLVGGVPIEEGTYVVERGGQRVGEEGFTVWLVDSGFRIDSRARIGHQSVLASLVLDPSWNPLYYAERGRSQVTFRIVDGTPTLRVGVGLFVRATEFAALPPFVLLGAEAVAPWFAVYRCLRTSPALERTAIVAGTRATAPLVGFAPEGVELVVGERTLPAERYLVRVGEREVSLYGQGDLLLALSVPSEGLVLYLQEILPGGLHLAP
ncbi:hypothetical protein H5T54_05790 [Candidatus Bipolaricaulota bacterium]|nr:hypothetical protein [Candidatus Bipolaricaulota bacterium]